MISTPAKKKAAGVGVVVKGKISLWVVPSQMDISSPGQYGTHDGDEAFPGSSFEHVFAQFGQDIPGGVLTGGKRTGSFAERCQAFAGQNNMGEHVVSPFA
ncbi:MAG: hypothetical protein HQL73_09310 [Magnetococcales bacterium]|nr:hypothetical protein [Magnetococcales bacterium]